MQSLRQSNVSRQLAEYLEYQPLVSNERGAPWTFLAGESRNLHSDWSRVRESPVQKRRKEKGRGNRALDSCLVLR